MSNLNFNPWAREHIFMHALHMAFGLMVVCLFHALLMWMVSEATKSPVPQAGPMSTNWLGCPIVGAADQKGAWGNYSVEIGVRGDGVMIWKTNL